MAVNAAQVLVDRIIEVLLMNDHEVFFAVNKRYGHFAAVATEAILISLRHVADTFHCMRTVAFRAGRLHGTLAEEEFMDLILFHGMTFCAESCGQRTVLLLAFKGAMGVVFGSKTVAGGASEDAVDRTFDIACLDGKRYLLTIAEFHLHPLLVTTEACLVCIGNGNCSRSGTERRNQHDNED